MGADSVPERASDAMARFQDVHFEYQLALEECDRNATDRMEDVHNRMRSRRGSQLKILKKEKCAVECGHLAPWLYAPLKIARKYCDRGPEQQ